jgi:hypothetical protein
LGLKIEDAGLKIRREERAAHLQFQSSIFNLPAYTFTSYPNARSSATTALSTTDKIAATFTLSTVALH